MDMAQGVVSVVVLVLARELAVSVLAMAMELAMELAVSGEEQQVVAREVDSDASHPRSGLGRHRLQLCRASGAVDT